MRILMILREKSFFSFLSANFCWLSLGWVKPGSYITQSIEKGSINDEADSLVHTEAEHTGRGRTENIRSFQWYNIFFYVLYVISEAV